MKKQIYILLGVLLVFSGKIISQPGEEFTNPFIINYENTEYKASTQNWCIIQDDDHLMWFGNLGKVLWYDGFEWGNVSIPNASIVRSLCKLNNNTIMAGAFAEFGSIEKDSFGQFHFRSWVEKLPEKYHDYTDVWKIHELNNTLYIQTFQYLFVFNDGDFTGAYESQNSFRFSFVSNGRLYVEEVGEGLKVLADNELILIPEGAFFSNKAIWYLSHINGDLLVGTQEQGIFLYSGGRWKIWNTKLNDALKSQALFCGLNLSDNSYLFGTVKNGILQTDFQGNIIKSINRNNGLQDNTVLYAASDHEGNIWLGLDRGIDYIKKNYQFQLLNSKEGFGTGYAAVEYQGILYLGTNQGVYSWSDTYQDFTILEGTAGQVWSFKMIDDELYCCHDKGIFQISGRKAFLAYAIEGVWKLKKVPSSESIYIAGTYNGFYAIRITGNASFWPISGFSESCRIFEFDSKGQLWMSHGYKGVYRVKLSPDFQEVENVSFYGINQGLPLNTNNEVFKYNDEIIIAGNDGFYRFNESIGLMEAFDLWNKNIPVIHPVSKIWTDKWERISFFNDEKISWAIFKDDTLNYFDSFSFIPLRNKLFYAFENIYFLDPERAIIGSIDGFSYYNRGRQFAQETPLHIIVKRLSSLQGRDGASNITAMEIGAENYKLPYQRNSIRIDLSVPAFQNRDYIQISYIIDKQKEQRLADNYSIFLQDLDDRNHTIEIVAKDLARNITSETLALNISILPPWYKKWYAFVAYFLVFALLVFTIVISMRKYFDKIKLNEQIEQQKKMAEQRQRLQKQAEEAERQLIIIRNEKLSIENRIKAEEIANSTMELVHKNKMLLDVKDTLKVIQKERDIESRNATIKDIIKKIDRDLDNEEKWMVFEKNFDEIHENFLNRLKETHPLLTSKDLRLCAYLRMNLSSKEIAPLLRISVRSVEISRYRLRKKLNLPREQSLSDYILLF